MIAGLPFKGFGLRKGLQAFGGRLRTPEFMRVQELLPFALAGLDQGLKRWEGQKKARLRGRPVLEGL